MNKIDKENLTVSLNWVVESLLSIQDKFGNIVVNHDGEDKDIYLAELIEEIEDDQKIINSL